MLSYETDFRYLSDHPRKLHDLYRGQWLAVVEGHIVARGGDLETVYQEARNRQPDAEILLEHIDRELTNPVYESV